MVGETWHFLRYAVAILIGDAAKFLGVVAGVGIASLLISQQLAIFNAVQETSGTLALSMPEVGIWVCDPNTLTVEMHQDLKRNDAERVRGVAGVAWAVPLIAKPLTVHLRDGSNEFCLLMGVDRMRPVAGPREVTAGDGQGWLRPHGVVVDARQAETLLSRFDPATGEQRPLQVGDHLVMNHRGMQVEGLANAPLTAGFLPIMWADYQTAEELIGSSETRSASFVLVGLDSETDAQAVADRIARSTGLAAYPTAAWIERNRTWMLTNSAIPLNFGITIAMGFLIGLAIAGQVFHQFVRDHTREFAVLRALGCGRLRLAMMVLVQALVTGFLGFGVGVGLAAVFDRAVQNTMLVSHLTGDLLVTTAIAVGIIVAVASLAGMWRVLRLDPAEVFRG